MSFKVECNRCQEQQYIEPGSLGSFSDVQVGVRDHFTIPNPLAQLCPDCVVSLKAWLKLK